MHNNVARRTFLVALSPVTFPYMLLVIFVYFPCGWTPPLSGGEVGRRHSSLTKYYA